MADVYIKYNTGDIFWIVPRTNPGLALNVFGTSVGTSTTQNVNLYERNADGTQAWYLDTTTSSGKAFLRCSSNHAYALDRYSPNNNCDVYPLSGNYTDANIDFHTLASEVHPTFSLSNVASGLYLTATGDANNNVVWASHTGADNQKWYIIKYDSSYTHSGGGSTTRTRVDLPMTRVFDWNQQSNAISSMTYGGYTIGDSGCSLTCLIDVANIFGSSSYTPQEVLNVCGWGASGVLTWAIPSTCAGYINAAGYSGSGTRDGSAYYTTVRSQIAVNNPVITKVLRSNGVTHFVVAVGYTGAGTSASDIRVLDPWVGAERSLQEVLSAYNATLKNYILTHRN